jgi:NADH:ubiquinone oxidoreductase subunit D
VAETGVTTEANDDADGEEIAVVGEPLLINMGPAHPATHGTVRIVI